MSSSLSQLCQNLFKSLDIDGARYIQPIKIEKLVYFYDENDEVYSKLVSVTERHSHVNRSRYREV